MLSPPLYGGGGAGSYSRAWLLDGVNTFVREALSLARAPKHKGPAHPEVNEAFVLSQRREGAALSTLR